VPKLANSLARRRTRPRTSLTRGRAQRDLCLAQDGREQIVGGPIAEIGLDVFNGDGKRGITRSTGISYVQSYDWTNGPWPDGSYTVDPDCTGSFFDANGTKANNIVVLDGGKRIRLEEEKD
jgi:hypothetical protein